MTARLCRSSLALLLCLAAPSPTLAETVVEAWRGGGFLCTLSVSVNPSDGSCWVGIGEYNFIDYDNSAVVRLSANGNHLWRREDFNGPVSLSANPNDDSCWVVDNCNDQVVHLAADGAQLWRGGGGVLIRPGSVSVNSTDGSCWVADTGMNKVTHFAANGTRLWRGGVFNYPWSVSVNSTDGSCWVADSANDQVVHLAADGAELWRGGVFNYPISVSVNPSDGSCWVANEGDDQVVHLTADGAEILRVGGFNSPWSVSANSSDGSCWVADHGDDQVVHLTADGVELWRGSGFPWPRSVSVNPSDGSCWVGTWDGQVVHLVVIPGDGACFLGFPVRGPVPLQVTFTDWSAGDITSWLWEFGDGATSAEENPTHTYTAPGHRTVSLTIVTDVGVGIQTRNRYILGVFPDVGLTHWAWRQVIACVDAGLVGGYSDGYHPAAPVTRDQMAVYISRALAGSDAAVPTGPAVATFPDVPTSHWAYKYIEYCYTCGVVGGYASGYRPAEIVNRAQMAVFVARSICDPTGEEGLAGYVPPTEPTFPDVLAGHWAYKYIEYCHDQGVVGGYANGYHPAETVNRAQMAVYVQRAFQLPM